MEENNMEQPMVDSQEQVADAKIEEGFQGIDQGSISKFKNSEALQQAYDSLEKEFTKKCQQLSQLQKESVDNKQDLPAYLQDDWKSRVDEFFNQNTEAKFFSEKISETIINDKSIANSKDPLEKAWIKVLKENYKSPTSLVEDEQFINEFVLKNNNIKNKIIKEYVNRLEENNAPALISKHNGTSSMLTPPIRPKSLEEANVIVKAMFKD